MVEGKVREDLLQKIKQADFDSKEWRQAVEEFMGQITIYPGSKEEYQTDFFCKISRIPLLRPNKGLFVYKTNPLLYENKAAIRQVVNSGIVAIIHASPIFDSNLLYGFYGLPVQEIRSYTHK
nr:hypothetical protein [Nanoarchaeum sp.]